MKSTLNFRVRYQETDQMGIVHNSVYLIWFEVGRTEWMRQKGMTYRDCERQGWLLPVVESGCRYFHPARYDDLLEIETVLEPENGAAFTFQYYIRRVEAEGGTAGLLLAAGFTKHVCISKDYKINKAATKELKTRFSESNA